MSENAEVLRRLSYVLTELDESIEPTCELSIRSRINALRDGEIEDSLELRAESMAFAFVEDYTHEATGWGTYFGPLAVLPNEQGVFCEAPSIKLIDEEIITYWLQRGRESSNPMLKARYLGLVWDFCQRTTGVAPSHDVGREYVANLLLIAERNLHKHEVDVIGKLRRALSVALSLNASDLVCKCKDAVLAYERRIAVDSKPGLWGFSFDLLVVNKKVALSQAEEEGIIADLEGRLGRLTADTEEHKPDPWTAVHAVEALASYYSRQKDTEQLRRVLNSLRGACEHIAQAGSPLIAYALLQDLHSRYVRFHLYDDADAIAVRLRELGPGVSQEMKQVSHTFEIPMEEIQALCEAATEGGLVESLPRVAAWFIPDREEVKERLVRQSKEFPLQAMFSRSILAEKGRQAAVISSVEQDIEGNVVRQIADDMGLWEVFLDAVLADMVRKYDLTADILVDLIYRSPVFQVQKREILKLGLQAYLDENYAVAVHLLIPQIEDAVRELVELAGGAVLKPVRQAAKSFDVKGLGELLCDPIARRVLGSAMTDYLKVLLADRRGWNLRNHVCHGLLPSGAFGKPIADRLIHVLLCLSLLREQTKAEPGSEHDG